MSFKLSDGYENHPSSWQSANTCTDISVGTTIDEHWLDFTGPLYLKVEESSEPATSKAYVCIFICEDTRAVYLELWTLRRQKIFCRPFVIWLIDVGWRKWFIQTTRPDFIKQKRCSRRQLKECNWSVKIDPNVVEDKLANQGVSWKFITERASHRGSHWESLLTTKRATQEGVGKSFSQLHRNGDCPD